jgi:large subunit ribosomal protein L18
MSGTKKQQIRERRKRGIRKRISGTKARPRLTVFRSSKHIYAQVVDDDGAISLAACSTLSKALGDLQGKSKIEKARLVGEQLAKSCVEKGIEQVVFDRNGYLYHGRVRGVAEGAREGGLKF